VKKFLPLSFFEFSQTPYLQARYRKTPRFGYLTGIFSPKLTVAMNITFEELRRIKHALPQGSIARIAQELNLDEQTVRNYFGAHNYKDGQIVEWHLEPGPNGGIVHLEDTTILERARQILAENGISIAN
jgi:hypothetical protein